MLKGSLFHPGGSHIPKKSSLSVPARGKPRTASLSCLRFVRRFAPKNPHAGKRGLLRLADPKRLRRVAPLCVSTREETQTASLSWSLEVASLRSSLCPPRGKKHGQLDKLSRFAPAGSTLVFMRDALSASLAGPAMSVTSDGMSLIGRNREFGRFLGECAIRLSPPYSLDVVVLETMLNRGSQIWYLKRVSSCPFSVLSQLNQLQRRQLDLRVGQLHPSSARLGPVI